MNVNYFFDVISFMLAGRNMCAFKKIMLAERTRPPR